jgi:hypothetical protein
VGHTRAQGVTGRGSQARRRGSHARRRAQLAGLASLALAVAAPWLLFHRTIALVAVDFRLELDYLVGWTPWALLAAGVAFTVPVVLSIGRHPESRLYPRGRNAYAGWGVTLYLLGLVLAVQVSQLANHVAPPR